MSYNCNNKDFSSNMIDDTISCGCDDDQLLILKGACSEDKLRGLLTVDTETTWTQIFIPEVLCIPEQKPDVKQIISITSIPEIFSQRVVKTPLSGTIEIINDEEVFTPIENQEGTILTGRKLIIEGLLKQKVIYTASLYNQPLHSAHFDVPFSAFIILPFNTPLTQKYKIEPCIEDIFVCRVTERQIFKNITLFVKATPLVC
ncbi:MAG: DUF3794 domain-containing protein [Sedimentibacter sp.]